MTSYNFDTSTYAIEVIAASMPEQQVEIISLRHRTLIDNESVTKTDIAQLHHNIKLRQTELTRDIKVTESAITLRLGSIVVIVLGAITALNRLL
jgi:hypothetical protein